MSAKSAASLPASLRSLALLVIAAASRPSFAQPAASPASQSAVKSDSSPTCATCHAAVVRNYSTAPMQHAMESDGANSELIAHPALTTTIGPYTYRVTTKDGHTTYRVTDGASEISVPIRWIFGQKTQTWVLEKDGQYYESLVSYYPRDNTLAITPDDANIKPTSLLEAMGRHVSTAEVRTCFDCHASGLVPGARLVPSETIPGIACERCHQGAQQHRSDAAADNFKTIPAHLKRLDTQQISNLCGQCHRTFDNVIRDRIHGNGTVRFQPYRLELSKCFIGNDPRISCIACHNPHQPADRVSSHYDGKCLACHAPGKAAAAVRNGKVCPVATSNCTSCHMPKTDIPGNHAQFTDHYIRVVKTGETYPQ